MSEDDRARRCRAGPVESAQDWTTIRFAHTPSGPPWPAQSQGEGNLFETRITRTARKKRATAFHLCGQMCSSPPIRKAVARFVRAICAIRVSKRFSFPSELYPVVGQAWTVGYLMPSWSRYVLYFVAS